MNRKPKYSIKVIYEGVRLEKGLYRQRGTAGDVRNGFKNSFNKNMPLMNLFSEVIPRYKIKNGEKELPQDYIRLLVKTSFINAGLQHGIAIAEIRATVLFFKGDTKKVIYQRKYFIERNSMVSGPSANQNALHDLITRIVDDISKGDFDNTDYEDIVKKPIDIEMIQPKKWRIKGLIHAIPKIYELRMEVKGSSELAKSDFD